MNRHIIMALTCLFISTQLTAQNENENQIQKIMYPIAGSVKKIDPASAETSYEAFLVTAIFDSLYEYVPNDKSVEIKPSLAESMPEISQDGTTYLIKVNKGVFFQNDSCFSNSQGREVTAQDVVYSLKRAILAAQPTWSSLLRGVKDWQAKNKVDESLEGIRSIGNFSLAFKLIKPNPNFILWLADASTSIVAQECVTHYGTNFATHPVGTSAWMIKDWGRPGLTLTKNPHYFKAPIDANAPESKQRIMEVEIKFLDQMFDSMELLNKGRGIFLIPPSHLKKIAASLTPFSLNQEYKSKFEGAKITEQGLNYLEFNWAQFGNLATQDMNALRGLRCALTKSFSWKDRVNGIYQNQGELFSGVIPNGIEGSKNTGLTPEQDLETSKKLLATHHWSKENMPELIYGNITSKGAAQVFDQTTDGFRKIGYPTEKIKMLNFDSFEEYLSAIKSGKLSLYEMNWELDIPAPENILQLFYSPNIATGLNTSGFTNGKYDHLYEKLQITTNSNERTGLIQEAQNILMNECIWISGFSKYKIYLWSKELQFTPNDRLGGKILKYITVNYAN